MEIDCRLRLILGESLGLGSRAALLEMTSPLRGAIPELDSMAVVTTIAAIEESFGIVVDDDDISGGTFETFGTLVEFVQRKLA